MTLAPVQDKTRPAGPNGVAPSARPPLADAPPALELPFDRPRPAVRGNRGGRVCLRLSADLAQRLVPLAADADDGLLLTLLAGFQAVLHRYTGQDDLVLGHPTDDGLLVLRTDLSGDPTFPELRRRAARALRAARAHPERPAGFQQVTFSFRHDSRPPDADLVHATLEADASAPAGDLALDVAAEPDGVQATFRYDLDLFDAATVGRLAAHYRVLLEGVAADPDRPVSVLPLLTEAERRELLVEWNATAADYPHDACVHHLVEAQVERTPDAVAVVCEGQSWTYRELNARANQLAHALRKRGVGPGALVGLCVERSLEMFVGLLGVLKAGAAYVPLDPAFPPERLAFMIEDARLAVLLTQAKPAPSASEGWRVPSLALGASEVCRESRDNPAPSAGPDDLAYVIYTSGSTGKPKGVQVRHGAVVNFLCSMRQRPGLAAADTLLAVTTLSFDIAGLECFLPLVVGAKVVVAGREVAADGTRLLELLIDCGATVMQATPATWRLLLDAGWRPEQQRLKVLCGGEALPRALANELLARSALWNLYGPTETTIWSTLHLVEPGDGPVSIGRPIANTQVYIVDRHLQPVPVGVPGELLIGGAGLARGKRGHASTAPATWPGGGPTARSSSSAGSTTRSRCAASASSWATSRRPCTSTRRCARPSSWPARTRPATSGWWRI